MKFSILLPVFLVFATVPSGSAQPDEVTFRSTSERTHLLELYTSEGCSSCPPAEKWMSQLKSSPRLWKEIVPIAFHVDYWDRLGWPDRFASKGFTARQRHYAAEWGSETVYTPGFVLDGREWQKRSVDRISAMNGDAGVLTATLRDRRSLAVTYHPSRDGSWEAHVAVLGFGLSSKINAGEKGGRELVHDFVALVYERKAMTMETGAARAEIGLPALSAGELGLAIWIAETGRPRPVQATGGKLPN